MPQGRLVDRDDVVAGTRVEASGSGNSAIRRLRRGEAACGFPPIRVSLTYHPAGSSRFRRVRRLSGRACNVASRQGETIGQGLVSGTGRRRDRGRRGPAVAPRPAAAAGRSVADLRFAASGGGDPLARFGLAAPPIGSAAVARPIAIGRQPTVQGPVPPDPRRAADGAPGPDRHPLSRSRRPLDGRARAPTSGR